MKDPIERQDAIDALLSVGHIAELSDGDAVIRVSAVNYVLRNLPTAQPNDWMERNKERILRAGMEGREIEFRIGGRLFAIREKAQ